MKVYVYVENNVTGRGSWIPLPLPEKELFSLLEEKHIISSDGTYQMSLLKYENFPPQEATGNLFTLNQNVIRFENLPDEQKEILLSIAFSEGISIETAFHYFL